jgi:hypothetical protein
VTLIELLFAVLIVASIVLDCVTILLLRDTLHTLVMQGSLRREWVRKEHTP